MNFALSVKKNLNRFEIFFFPPTARLIRKKGFPSNGEFL